MKGIILAGGSGTRLYPLTIVTSKQLLPVYDKPMIFYPLSVLMEAGIRDILIISTPQDQEKFRALLGDGSSYGIHLSYEVQPSPDGLAQAFIIGEKFIDGEPCAMILGDNIFYGAGLKRMLIEAVQDADNGSATIFAYHVNDPKRFGIVEFDKDRNVLSIEEKPENPKSNYCVTGLYFYDGHSSELAKTIKPSDRGELEITDLNNLYLKQKKLKVKLLDMGFVWMDTGTFDSLMEASNYVQTMSKHQDLVICSPELTAYMKGWISREQLIESADRYGKSPYGQAIKKIAERYRWGTSLSSRPASREST